MLQILQDSLNFCSYIWYDCCKFSNNFQMIVDRCYKKLFSLNVIHSKNILKKLHYHFLVQGHCGGISAGSHILSFHLETCDRDRNFIRGHTGWEGHTNRIIVEEFRPNSNIIGGNLCFQISSLTVNAALIRKVLYSCNMYA